MNYIIIFFQVFSGITAIITIVHYYVAVIDNGVDNEYGDKALISVCLFFFCLRVLPKIFTLKIC